VCRSYPRDAEPSRPQAFARAAPRENEGAEICLSRGANAHQGPWWMLGLGGLFKGDDSSNGGVSTLEKPASTGPLPPGSVEGIPRTFYDGYTAEDGNMAKNEQGFYYLKEDKRAKINPFEKVRR